MEPYCADLTNEEVRVLEELLKPPEDEAEHYKVKNSRAHPVPPKPIRPSPTLSPHSLPALSPSIPSGASLRVFLPGDDAVVPSRRQVR